MYKSLSRKIWKYSLFGSFGRRWKSDRKRMFQKCKWNRLDLDKGERRVEMKTAMKLWVLERADNCLII